MYYASQGTGVRLSQQFIDAVMEFERDSGIPVRVYYGNWRNETTNADREWTQRHLNGSPIDDVTLEHAQEHGITYIVNGAPLPFHFGYQDLMPEDVFVGTPGARAPAVYDYIYLHENPDDLPTWTFPEGTEGGVVMPRAIYDFRGIALMRADDVNWQVVQEALASAGDPEFQKQWAEGAEDRARQRIIDYFARVPKRQIDQKRREQTMWERNLQESQEGMLNALKELRTLGTEIERMQDMANLDHDKILAEWDKLSEHPRIEQLSFEGNLLRIQTDDITMTHPLTGETRWLGRLVFRIEPENNRVVVENLDNPREGHAHPHAPGGAPCWGGYGRVIYDALSQANLFTAFELMLTWAESLNPADDYGRWAAKWFGTPDVPPEDRPNRNEEEAEAVLV